MISTGQASYGGHDNYEQRNTSDVIFTERSDRDLTCVSDSGTSQYPRIIGV